ncbi:hypothetical protein DLAC_02636 [Tieghemostelium lacteum]|uniref:Histidine kinase n=1 Tax=Tieghemostelium lacteum TaxID=361077 RepID=A0A152A2X4_TIELA|nr:hypothetical protein DLAC_02636 [Tieghemostelium lacteum]|eukprot:KYR00612.1 hypothetical protein DLAC_02636 [Tieghemostelium lacteum]
MEKTEREIELEIAESNFRIIANSAPFALWLSGLDKKCSYFNKSWLEFTGRTMEQELGVGWAEGVHPEDVENCLNIYVSFFNERKPFKMEYRLRRYDGAYRWVLDTGAPRYSPSGEFLGYCGSCIDVTDMWFAHHEMATYSKQQNELLKCTNELINLYKLQQQPSQQQRKDSGGSNSSSSTCSSSSSMSEYDKFFDSILKSATISTGSQSAVLFKFNPENALEIIAESSYNFTSEQIPLHKVMFALPLDFWDEVVKQHQYHQQQHHEISITNILYSILTQKYFLPFLTQMGAKSITSVTVLGNSSGFQPEEEDGNSRPYGYICVCNVGEKEFSAIEQNTLAGIAMVVSIYLHKSQEDHYSKIKDSISSTIAKTSSNAIITVDSTGKFLDLNPKAIEILKMDQIDSLSISSTCVSNYFNFYKTSQSLVHYNHESANNTTTKEQDFYNQLTNYLTVNNLFDMFFETNCFVQSSGQQLPVELFIKQVHLNSFTSIFLFIFRDSKQHLDRLEMMVKKSVQENLEKTLFLSRLSHEIRNPLNCIINMSEILLDTSYSIEQKDILETINMAGNNLRTLIDDVLDISKIESGKLEIKNEPFKIRECLEQSLSMVSLSAQKKGVELALLFDTSVPDVIIADHSKLIEVLINTIGNGVKFTDHGSVVVSVYAKPYLTTLQESQDDTVDLNNSSNSITSSTSSTSVSSSSNSSTNMTNSPNSPVYNHENNNTTPSTTPTPTTTTTTTINNNQKLLLQSQYPQQQLIELFFMVRDKGIGIPTSEIDKLFNNFTQVHLNSSQYGGTGLGLAISKKIIELMGGSINVKSEYGKGTTVSFSIISAIAIPNHHPLPMVNPPPIPTSTTPSTSGLSLSSSSNSVESIRTSFKTSTFNPVQRRKSLLDVCSDKRILIIAKDEDVRSMITSYARLMLFQISSFENFVNEDEVLNILNNSGDKFDLIMIDYPFGCNDHDFKTILQMFTTHVVYQKLIMMIPMTFVQHNYYSDLIDSFITKPVKLSSFEETVLKLLTCNTPNISSSQPPSNFTSTTTTSSTTTTNNTSNLSSLPPLTANHQFYLDQQHNQSQPTQQHGNKKQSTQSQPTTDRLYDSSMASKLPLTILSTEDNEVNQKVISMIFSKLGYTIDQAGNGVVALEMISKKKYDFVFLDIEMPIMGGLACARSICTRYPLNQRPNLIALTGRALPEQIQECKDSGMIDYLVKPLKVNRIIEILKKYSITK